jgi:hypothetical protein
VLRYSMMHHLPSTECSFSIERQSAERANTLPHGIAAQTANKRQHYRKIRLLASARIIITAADTYASTARIQFP